MGASHLSFLPSPSALSSYSLHLTIQPNLEGWFPTTRWPCSFNLPYSVVKVPLVLSFQISALAYLFLVTNSFSFVDSPAKRMPFGAATFIYSSCNRLHYLVALIFGTCDHISKRNFTKKLEQLLFRQFLRVPSPSCRHLSEEEASTASAAFSATSLAPCFAKIKPVSIIQFFHSAHS